MHEAVIRVRAISVRRLTRVTQLCVELATGYLSRHWMLGISFSFRIFQLTGQVKSVKIKFLQAYG